VKMQSWPKSIQPVSAARIASFLGAEPPDPDFEIHFACPSNALSPGGVCFVKHEQALENTPFVDNALILVPEALHAERAGLLAVSDARLAFARILQEFFVVADTVGIHPTATVSSGAQLGNDVSLHAGCVIEDGVSLGDGCVIEANVFVARGSVIGARSKIRANSVIGGQGFGVVPDENQKNVKLPHLGGVHIGEDVEIGALNTVVSGTLAPTIVGDRVKTDDHVHIAHNCKIGADSIITACAEISGSVTIGERAWLGPNCSVINGATLGDDIYVGIGACVTKSFGEGDVIAGVPARVLRKKS
jgi:UDP-3-O-[3-hydroxymyristoyl] glucosamine N-acyltransferase LpxD